MLRNIIFDLLYILCLIGQLRAPNLSYRLYHSDRVRISNMYYDCLLFNEAYEPAKVYRIKKTIPPYQVIPFCIRPFDQLFDTSIGNTKAVIHGTPITFETLQNQNITSENLYLSAVPIDVIERYQEFLESSNKSLSTNVIYNCTIPWFGEFCQYTFNSTLLFNTIVREYFNNKVIDDLSLLNATCFTFLKCNRGPSSLCLDWREVCDGKIDCLNNGIDEAGCEALANTECKSNEYLCANGFCIPSDFFDDDELNPDCVDRSDEADNDQYVNYLTDCIKDPAFRCEETSCRNEYESFCALLGCRIFDCEPFNDEMRRATYSWKENYHLSFDCWNSLICLTINKENDPLFKDVNCSTKNINKRLFEESCLPVFFFPAQPILFNHVRLVYGRNFIHNSSLIYYLAPYYVCYDEQLCDFLPPTISINGASCRHLSETNIEVKLRFWTAFELSLLKLFRKCSNKYNHYDQCPKSKPYRCANSSKCLPLNQLVDGYEDCFQGDDEYMINSCQLPDKNYRFQCEGEDKCVSITQIAQLSHRCSRSNNNTNQIQMSKFNHDLRSLLFSVLCDGFIHSSVIDGANDTDEMDCQYWPCNNVYTRCDDNGKWHCLNGADELDCPRNPCRPNGHPCVLPDNNTLVCLPLSRFNDGVIDCLGAYDERAYCRTYIFSPTGVSYRCFNTTQCVFIGDLCPHANHPLCALNEAKIYPPSLDDFCQDSQTICENLFSSSWQQTFNLQFYLCSLLADEETDTIKFFTLKNHLSYPMQDSTNQTDMMKRLTTIDIVSNKISIYDPIQLMIDDKTNILCNRGIPIYSDDSRRTYCLCPPAYFGYQCEYQSQRVSVTLQFRAAEWRTHFHFIIMLIDNSTNIHSYEQIDFLSVRDCSKKFNVYLLYSTRPKFINDTYCIRIDVYDKMKIKYYTSLLYPIQFSFLPVHRLAFQIDIPLQDALFAPKKCSLKCLFGQCQQYLNSEDFFCHCSQGYSGTLCSIKNNCDCSPGSICVGTSNNRSICVCPQGKFGPRCYLNMTACRSHSCQNDSQCIETDVKLSESEYFCLCAKGSVGSKCTNTEMKIEFYFDKNISIPQSMFIHFFQLPVPLSKQDAFFKRDYGEPIQTSRITKISYAQNAAIIYHGNPFHLIFVEFNQDYYLALLQHNYTLLKKISTTIIPQHRCQSIRDLLKQEIQSLPTWHRAKYYHIPCQNHSNLTCFYDNDYFMCLCNIDRHANCFKFDYKQTGNCFGYNYCQNDGQCYQDNKTCPTSSSCFCKECYFGTRCQFTTTGFGLSLDNILGYSIWPNIPFSQQPSIIKISTAFTILMFTIAIINSILSFITFRRKRSLNVGCGYYLLASSIISISTMTLFTLKLFLLIFSQMSMIINHSFLLINCIMMDMLLKSFLAISDWLNACVAIERVMTAYIGVKFNKTMSKKYAKWTILGICIFTLASYIPDPIYRELLEDNEEQRRWCVVGYPSAVRIYIMIINIIHFCIPLGINVISVLIIIVLVARQKSTANSHETYGEHLMKQYHQHKHRLLSSIILILVATPRLIISFLSKCMASARNPGLYLAGYFISFVPPLLVFVLYVLPSKYYRKEFNAATVAIRKTVQRRFRRQEL